MLFGGWSLLARSDRVEEPDGDVEPLNRNQIMTLAMIGVLIVGIVIAEIHVGMGAFAAAVILGLLGASNQEEAIKRMPWGTIMLVCGVTVLINLLEMTSGMDLFVDMLTRVSSTGTIIPLLAGTVGLISAYSSTSGVVPARVPPDCTGTERKSWGRDGRSPCDDHERGRPSCGRFSVVDDWSPVCRRCGRWTGKPEAV